VADQHRRRGTRQHATGSSPRSDASDDPVGAAEIGYVLRVSAAKSFGQSSPKVGSTLLTPVSGTRPAWSANVSPQPATALVSHQLRDNSGEPRRPDDGTPDFLRHLQVRLGVHDDAALLALGEWLRRYQPVERRAIRILSR